MCCTKQGLLFGLQALSSMLEALQRSLNEECEGRKAEAQARADAQERCSAADEHLSKLEWESNQATVSLQQKVRPCTETSCIGVLYKSPAAMQCQADKCQVACFAIAVCMLCLRSGITLWLSTKIWTLVVSNQQVKENTRQNGQLAELSA